MNKQIKEATQLSMVNGINKESHKAIKTEKPRKVKRTFYILEVIANQLDAYYAQRLVRNEKVDKSDIVAYAITTLLEEENPDVKPY